MDDHTIDALDLRRRRAAYRCAHRGTKEMDIMLGRYAEATLQSLVDPELTRFERFIQLPDPELQGWLLNATGDPALEFADLIENVRRFHGL